MTNLPTDVTVYMLFSGQTHYARGGMHDLDKTSLNKQELLDRVKDLEQKWSGSLDEYSMWWQIAELRMCNNQVVVTITDKSEYAPYGSPDWNW